MRSAALREEDVRPHDQRAWLGQPHGEGEREMEEGRKGIGPTLDATVRRKRRRAKEDETRIRRRQ